MNRRRMPVPARSGSAQMLVLMVQVALTLLILLGTSWAVWLVMAAPVIAAFLP